MATIRTKSYLLTRFEAGDRPTDVDFADLFESICILGETGLGSGGQTTGFDGNVTIGGALTLTGQFVMPAELMVGSITETLNMPIQAYSSDDETVIFASGSISDNLFQGVSGDSTSSIRLQDDLTHVRFGTHTNKGFLEVQGEEIIYYTTGSSTTPNLVHISGSVGINTEGAGTIYNLDVHGDVNGIVRAYGPTIGRYSLENSSRHYSLSVQNTNLYFFDETAGTTRMLLNSSGNLGIGTTSPSARLDIVTSGGEGLEVNVDTGHAAAIFNTALDYVAKFNSTDATSGIVINDVNSTNNANKIEVVTNTMHLTTNNNRNVTILNTGKVGIGTTAPGHQLHVYHDTDDVNIKIKTDKTDGRAQIRFENDVQEFVAGTTTNDKFVVYDATNATTPFTIEPGTGNHTLFLNSNEKVGIGTTNPTEKLTIHGGHVSMSNQYGIISNQPTANYGIYPYHGANTYSFTNISNSPTPGTTGLKLESDQMIHFAESDGNTLGVQFDMNNKQFRFDGPITASHFIGDGSGLTGVNAQQVVGFITNDVNNYVLTAGGNSTVIGEANLQFDGSQLYVNGEIGVGQSNPTAQIEVGTTRPLYIGAGATPASPGTEGSISSQGQSGGWANYFKFLGSSKTDHGGFYGVGNADAFTRWGIAPAYDSEYGLHVVAAGNGASKVEVGIGTVSPSSMLHIHASATTTASLHIESDGSSKDSTIHLRQAGALYGAGTAGTGVDLVYDGGTDYFMLKGYTNNAGLEGEGFKYRPETDDNTLVLREHYKIGMGTLSPSYNLHIVSGSGDPSIMVETQGTDKGAFIRFRDDNQHWRIGKNTGDNFAVYDSTGGVTPFSIEKSTPDHTLYLEDTGNVGIGIDNPLEKLHVHGNLLVSSSNSIQGIEIRNGRPRLRLHDQDGASYIWDMQTSNGDFELIHDGTVVMHVDQANNEIGINTNNPTAMFTVWGAGTEFGPSADGSNMIEWIGGTGGGYTGYLGIDDTAVHLGHTSTVRDLRFQTDETTRMTIQSGSEGKVGIGTTNPRGNLHIHKAGGTDTDHDLLHLSVQSSGTENTGSIKFSDAGEIHNQHYKIQFLEGSNRLKFVSDQQDNVLVLEPGGMVGIGIDNPTYNLHVVGTTNITGDLTVGGVTTSGGTLTFPGVNWNDPTDGNALNNTHIVETAFSFPLTGDGATIDYGAKSSTSDLSFVQVRLKDNNTGDSFRIYIDDYQGAAYDRIPFEAFGDKVLLNQDGGNTGIGTTAPAQKLHVIGKAQIENLLIISSSGQTDEGGQINLSKASGYTGQVYMDVYQDDFRIIQNDGSSDSTRFKIKNDGTVIIGPGTNTQLGHAHYTDYAVMTHQALDDTLSSNYAFMQHSSGTTYVNASAGKDIHFRIANVSYGKVEDDGQWGIGTGFTSSDPSYRLHVSGSNPTLAIESNSVSGDSKIYLKQGDGSSTGFWMIYDGGDDKAYFKMEDSVGAVSTKMTIEHAGNVGIGTTNPAVKLQIEGTSNELLRLVDTDNGGDPYISFYASNGTSIIRRGYLQSVNATGTSAGNDFRIVNEYGCITLRPGTTDGTLDTGGTEAVRVLPGGNVSIGSTSANYNAYGAGDGTFSTSAAKLRVTGTVSAQGGAVVADSFRSWKGPSNGSSTFTTHQFKLFHVALSAYGYSSHRMLIKSSGNSDAKNVACVMDFALKNQSGSAPGRFTNVANNYADHHISAKLLDVVQWTNGAYNGGARNGSSDAVNSSSYPRIYEFWLYGSGTSHDALDVTLLGNASATPHWGNEALSDTSLGDEFYTQVWAPSLSNGNGSARWNKYKELDGLSIDPGNDATYMGTTSTRYQQADKPTLIIEGRTDQGSAIGFKDNDADGLWMMGYSNHNGNTYTNSLEFRHTDAAGANDTITTWSYIGRTNQGLLQFTGQHRCMPAVGQVSDYADHVGKIVSSTGEYDNSDEGLNKTTPSINEALPKVKLSNKANDKRAFGIISDKEDENDDSRTFSQGSFHSVTPKSDNRLIINSLGEGGIWVSNYNGNLVNGDYITTSPIDGVGQKQDDDLLHNYTVAKITQDCDFDNTTDLVTCQAPDGTYQMKFVGCTYHCG
jgi:hypothetical protein